jgi:hypothetical protein
MHLDLKKELIKYDNEKFEIYQLDESLINGLDN